MNRFAKKYTGRILFAHLVSSAVVILVFFAFYALMNSVLDGKFIRFIQGYSHSAAYFLMTNQTIIIFIMFLIALLVTWIAVEIVYVRRIMNVFGQLGVLFTNDDALLSLRKEFYDIEHNLNELKMKSIKNEQLARTEMERKNDLIAYLAHDIKTPLSSIIGYLSILEETPDMPVEYRAKYTGITLQKAYRLESLIDEFFDITRFNLSEILLEKEEIKLQFMLQQMADEFYPMLQSRGNTIHLQVPEQLSVSADPDKIARVFNNIIKNAVSYSKPDTEILIRAREIPNRVQVQFINQGREIPQEKLKTIFEKFYRLDAARSTNTGGAGLGLPIAKEIVTAHGGEITAQSNPRGTAFTISLPAS